MSCETTLFLVVKGLIFNILWKIKSLIFDCGFVVGISSGVYGLQVVRDVSCSVFYVHWSGFSVYHRVGTNRVINNDIGDICRTVGIVFFITINMLQLRQYDTWFLYTTIPAKYLSFIGLKSLVSSLSPFNLKWVHDIFKKIRWIQLFCTFYTTIVQVWWNCYIHHPLWASIKLIAYINPYIST